MARCSPRATPTASPATRGFRRCTWAQQNRSRPMPELLRIEGLSAGYGQAVVLQDIALTLPEGQTLALLGRNGAGKTTLIDTLAGATRQHAGTIHLGGVALHPLPPHHPAAAGIGWVPQERNIFASLTVHENLTAVARPARARAGTGEAAGTDASTPARPRPWTPERVYDMFPRLAERKTHLGTQLSGGEQQILPLRPAPPPVLRPGEPLEGLAPIIVQELLRAIRRITREEGLSAIIVEQHPQAILAISDHAAVLDRGRIVHTGSAATLRQQPGLLDGWLGVTR